MNGPGIDFTYNGRTLRLRAFAITEVRASGVPPKWLVDVDGSKAEAYTWDTAVLYAARAADSVRAAEETRERLKVYSGSWPSGS